MYRNLGNHRDKIQNMARTCLPSQHEKYAPRRSLLERRQRANRRVGPALRSGETQELLLDIVDRADAEVGGVFALIAAGEEGLNRAKGRTDAPVGALTTFEE